jgi:DNA-binding beta-propeller fold protein YncE
MRLGRLACAVALAAASGAGCSTPITFPATGSYWPAATTPAYVRDARFAVTQNLSDKLDYISATQPMELGTTPVGDIPVELEGPHHIAASPDGKYIYFNLSNYVPGTGSGPHGSHGLGTALGSVVKLDAATQEKVAEVLVDRSPGDIILTKDGSTAYVSHYDLLRLQQQLAQGAAETSAYSDVAVVDTATMVRLAMIPVCVTAHGEGLSADEKTLYVSCAQSDQLAVLDVSDRSKPKVTQTLPVGPTPVTIPGSTNPSYGPYALAVSPADGSVWLSDNNSADVRVYDPKTQAMDPARTVTLTGVVMFGDFSKDGSFFYVPAQGSNTLTRIDTTTLATTVLPLPMESCLNPHAIRQTPDFSLGVVVCEGDHVKIPGSTVYVAMDSFSLLGFVTLDMFPDGAAWLPPM